MTTDLDKYADAEPSWDFPVIIESHINGVRSKEMNPNTPISYDEIAEDAIRCWEAGACAIHAHNTSFDLLAEDAVKDYLRSWDRVLAEHPDITWYPTTCNNLRLYPESHGLEHVPPLRANANVKIACVDTGISLFATSTDEEGYIRGREYGWNYDRVAGQVRMCRELDIPMILGIYEPGYARLAKYYVDAGMTTRGSMWDFYLIGDYGLTALDPIGTCGMQPSLESLYYYLSMIEDAKVKHPWYISIWGQGALDDTSILRRAIELGGHIKTGLELFYDPDRNPTNLELLQQAQEIAREVGRPIATQDDARKLYHIA
ncbi:BKACE family enzyme [Nakamurella leprariae]|uniref:3-keto-5-aminohexanoate cleavage protein n=1 Tax=Nakamurella leprariae TaxID=2803911 RepID=A0A938YE75_9ACTN|nr:3-keto-5-aminohexanoate cleavage protein [Nakamurella leprariae]MBM9466807.1 3-keto-5-aminohexanoate cleavage protein [Nakamurella leprariae]